MSVPAKSNQDTPAMFIRAYLRASTRDQDADRARAALDAFVAQHGLRIAAYYVENETGTKLDRPELMRLLKDSGEGDVILLEQVDRLSRLTASDWEKLKAEISGRCVRVVALDLPTSHGMLNAATDEFTCRMLEAVNAMLLDMLAAVARKDYDDRRRRAAEGIAKAKAAGKFKGRPEDAERNERIAKMLRSGATWSDVLATFKCSRSTLSVIAARVRAEKEAV
jgi:DNA invertase Pin-like site-specific DNA recombinase